MMGWIMIRDLNYYTYEIPESMTEKEVMDLFQNFFKHDRHLNNKKDNIKILVEISARQWRTYSLVEESIKKGVDEYLRGISNIDDLDEVDDLIQIAISLGSKDLYEYIINNAKNKDVLEMIAEYQREIIDISDPYVSFR